MDMKVDSKLIKSEREKRAWSQEHLATVAGLGVRTVHRIENTGSSSLDSLKALASVFEIDVAELLIAEDAVKNIVGRPTLYEKNIKLPLVVTGLLLVFVVAKLAVTNGIGIPVLAAVLLTLAVWFQTFRKSRLET